MGIYFKQKDKMFVISVVDGFEVSAVLENDYEISIYHDGKVMVERYGETASFTLDDLERLISEFRKMKK